MSAQLTQDDLDEVAPERTAHDPASRFRTGRYVRPPAPKHRASRPYSAAGWVVLRACHIDDPDGRSAGETCCRDDPRQRGSGASSPPRSRALQHLPGSCRVRSCPAGTFTADPRPCACPPGRPGDSGRSPWPPVRPTGRARRLHHLSYPLRIPSRSGLGGQMRFTKGARAVSLQDQYVHNWRTNDRIGTLPPRRATRRGGA